MPQLSRFPYICYLSNSLLAMVKKDYISVSGIAWKGLAVCIKWYDLVDYSGCKWMNVIWYPGTEALQELLAVNYFR